MTNVEDNTDIPKTIQLGTETYENLNIKLSEGFLEIYLFKNKKGEKFTFGIKEKKNLNNNFQKSKIINILLLIQSINRPDIIKIKKIEEDHKYIYILFEYCENGTLQDLINKRKKLTESEVQCYLLQLILALNYLHFNNIIHNHLNLSSLYLSKNMELKIGDFSEVEKLNSNNIEYEYEYDTVKTDKNPFEDDIKSIGNIMYNLLIGEKYSADKKECIQTMINNKISKAAQDLIKQILFDPKIPTLNQIIYHDFFNRGGIPKYFPESTLYNPPEGFSFSEEILDKNVVLTDLKLYIRPTIKPITYESIKDINDIIVNNINDIDVYITKYYDYSNRFGVGYLLNNGLLGVYFRDKTKMALNPENNKLKYIKKNDEVYNYLLTSDYPNELENKIKILKRFQKYFNDLKEKEKKSDIKKEDNNVNQNKSDNKNNEEEKDIIGKNDENELIYIENLINDNQCIFFKLSNQIQHIFFKDQVEIIMSSKVLTYIDKNKNKTNMPLETVLKNPIQELITRYNYIRYIYFNLINKKITKKIEKIKNGEISEEKDDETIIQ